MNRLSVYWRVNCIHSNRWDATVKYAAVQMAKLQQNAVM